MMISMIFFVAPKKIQEFIRVIDCVHLYSITVQVSYIFLLYHEIQNNLFVFSFLFGKENKKLCNYFFSLIISYTGTILGVNSLF